MKIAIPTLNRADTIESGTLAVVKGLGYPIYLFVADEEQKKLYSNIKDVEIVVTNKRGIASARNAILDYFGKGAEVVQMDDDVEAIYKLENGELSELSGILLAGFMEQAFYDIKQKSLNLWGVYPVPNEFYMSRKITNGNFIIGTFCGIIVSDIRCDDRLLLKEDYDFTLSHIKAGGVQRYDWITVKAKHYKNKGGAVDFRDDVKEQTAIAILKEKWGDWVRNNPRRKNEILIKRGL
jgi:hypothetical protein